MSDFTALELRPVYTVLLPLAASLLIFTAGRAVKYLSEIFSVITASLTALSTISMLSAVLAGKEIDSLLITMTSDMGMTLGLDSMGMFFAAFISVLWVITTFWSLGVTSGRGRIYSSLLYGSASLSVAGIYGMCFARDLISLFVSLLIVMVSGYPAVICDKENIRPKFLPRFSVFVIAAAGLYAASMYMIIHAAGNANFRAGGFIEPEMLTGGKELAAFLMMTAAGLLCSGMVTFHRLIPELMRLKTPGAITMHSLSVFRAMIFFQ